MHIQFETSYETDSFSHNLIEAIVGYSASQGLSQQELDAWAEDLRALGKAGTYFFSSNEYLHQGIKP